MEGLYRAEGGGGQDFRIGEARRFVARVLLSDLSLLARLPGMRDEHCFGNLRLPSGHCPRCHDLPLAKLKRRRVLAVGQADDLVFDNGNTRLWLSRCGVEDGEPYENKVTVETLRGTRDEREGLVWQVYRSYRAI